MSDKRVKRLNSLLKEVISEVVREDVRNPLVSPLLTITSVDITKDLHHAKVYISIIGTEEERKATIKALQSAAGYISVLASKKVVLRHFPSLTFKLDSTVDDHMKIDKILKEIQERDQQRKNSSETNDSSI